VRVRDTAGDEDTRAVSTPCAREAWVRLTALLAIDREKQEPMTEQESLATIASALNGIRNELRQIHINLQEINAKTPAPKSNILG
jgi:hypothetical protein